MHVRKPSKNLQQKLMEEGGYTLDPICNADEQVSPINACLEGPTSQRQGSTSQDIRLLKITELRSSCWYWVEKKEPHLPYLLLQLSNSKPPFFHNFAVTHKLQLFPACCHSKIPGFFRVKCHIIVLLMHFLTIEHVWNSANVFIIFLSFFFMSHWWNFWVLCP